MMKHTQVRQAHSLQLGPQWAKWTSKRRIVCPGKGSGDKAPVTAPEERQERRQLRREVEQGKPAAWQEPSQPPLTSQRGMQEVPEVVNQRLLSRMLIFSLVPVFLGFLSLPLLAYIQVGLKVDLPQGTAFVISGVCFGAGLLGITYGILSASWDENEDGSGLGIDEFKSNTAPLIERIKKGPRK